MQGLEIEMTREERHGLLQMYRAWTKASRSYRELHEKDWKDALLVYRHRHYAGNNQINDTRRLADAGGPDRDMVSLNMTYAAINTERAATNLVEPDFTVTPCSISDRATARARERWLECAWRQYHFKDPFVRAYSTYLITGHAWVKVGWKHRAIERPATKADKNEQGVFVTSDVNNRVSPVAADKDGKGFTKIEEIEIDEPTVHDVSIFDMLVDTVNCNMSSMRYICQEVYMDKLQATHREDWNKEARECMEVIGQSDHDRRLKLSNASCTTDFDEQVKYIEFYDLRNGTVCHFHENGDEFLMPPHKYDAPIAHPYELIAANSLTDDFYTVSDVHVARGQQHLLDRSRTTISRALARTRFQEFAPEEVVNGSEQAQQAIKGQHDDVVIGVPHDIWSKYFRAGQSPFVARGGTDIPAEVFLSLPQIGADFRTLMGTTSQSLGAGGSPYESATSTTVENTHQELRGFEQTTNLQDFISAVMVKVLEMASRFQKIVLDVPGQRSDIEVLGVEPGPALADDQEVSFGISRQDLGTNQYAGYMLDVNASPRRSDRQRQDAALHMAQTILPILQIAQPQGWQLNMGRFLQLVIEDGFGYEDASDIMIAPDQVNQGPQGTPDGIPSTPGSPQQIGGAPQGGAPPRGFGEPQIQQ